MRVNVCTGTEELALIANDEARVLRAMFEALQCSLRQLQHAAAQRVGFAMKLKQQHAVAHVKQAGFKVGLQAALRSAQRRHVNLRGLARNRHILALGGLVLLAPARTLAVESFVAASQHLLDPWRNRIAIALHAPHSGRHAQHVPILKRAGLLHVAPAHGGVNRGDVVADFRDARGAVAAGKRQRVPHVLRGAVRVFYPGPQALAQVGNLAHGAD